MFRWFVHPHAVDAFGERANLIAMPTGERLQLLKRELSKVTQEDLKPGRNNGEFVIRIAVAHKPVIYAIAIPMTDSIKGYDFRIVTIVTRSMYSGWRKDQKLGTFADLLKDRE